MAKPLVIVESPTKAKTIAKFLGDDYVITASYGHIRDLPNSAAEIPESQKKKPWARLGVDVDSEFAPLYVVPDTKKKQVSELKKLLKNASVVYLATDEDREGESISWHLLEVLKPKVPVKRLVFHEITKAAINHAVENAREVDQNLVRAQETRRIVDRLFGYSVSPLLWKKMMRGLSAGRVQSVAMRLLVERERERIRFRTANYWDLKATLAKDAATFDAELTHLEGKRVASGKDFDPDTGELANGSKVAHLDEKKARALHEKLGAIDPTVESVESKPYTSKPYPPFTTSTLQQEASRKLRFSAKRTMAVAQTLYENGFITYMRTDSTTLSGEALTGARSLIGREFGGAYLPAEPRVYKTKVKNAQEAHEAIRPSGEDFASPAAVKKKLGGEAHRVYELIWKRTLASQMKDARGTRVTVLVQCDDAKFRASGKTIEFPGYLRAYVEGSDDPDADLADKEKILPAMQAGDALSFESLEALGHDTQPPARYTEGSLIKELERRGIGRPSTWATIVEVVLSRTYAYKKGTALVPSFLAAAVTRLMEDHFTNLLDYEFTARLEDDLDAISRGEADNLEYLNQFYFGNAHPGLKTLVDNGQEKIDPREVCGIEIATLDDGRKIEVRIGRYGPFLTDGEHRAGLPETLAPDELTLEKATELLEEAARGPESLGDDPDTGLNVFVKNGRYGPYVQLGPAEKDGEKPKMASLLPGQSPTDLTLEVALQLLSLPRTLGQHPENGEDVIAANGRYGPYVKCGSETRNLPAEDATPIDVTLEKAVEILKRPRTRRGQAAPKNLRELGKHPINEQPLVIKSGRYGPYVTDGEVNASLPRGMDPAELTIEEAVNLLEARAAKIAAGGGKKKTKKKAAKKKTAKKKVTKKTAAKKKAPAKKTAAKRATKKSPAKG